VRVNSETHAFIYSTFKLSQVIIDLSESDHAVTSLAMRLHAHLISLSR